MSKFVISELCPVDGRKSFYHKAKLILEERPGKKNRYFCRSYSTIVCGYDAETQTFSRYWVGYSATTARHIDSFIVSVTDGQKRKYSKKEWEEMEVKNLPDSIKNCVIC